MHWSGDKHSCLAGYFAVLTFNLLSTDVDALWGYSGAGGSNMDPTRLPQPLPALERQGKPVSNTEGNFTMCCKNTRGWELTEHLLYPLHRRLE